MFAGVRILRRTMLRHVVLRHLVVSAAIVTFLFAPTARAEYPDHLINAVVPFSAGGTTDAMARMMSAELSKALGQTIVVENKAGAASLVGTRYVTGEKADGYTLLFTSSAATNAPAMFRHLPYDPIKDIQPVALYAQAPLMVAVSTTTVKAKTLSEFIAYLRANPGKLNAATSGNGTTLSAQLFLLKNGATAQMVPYKGSGEAILAVATGQVDFIIADALTLGPSLDGGQVKALAVTAEQRLPTYPDVPTSAEAGMPGYLDIVPAALYVRAGTPRDIVDRLNGAVRDIVSKPDVVERLGKLSWVPVMKTVDQTTDWYVNEIAQWKDIVKQANIPPQD